MEAQHKWNQSSGSRLKQNSEKDLAPTPRALTLPLFNTTDFLLFSKTPFPLPLLLLGLYFHDTCHLAYFFNGYNSRYGHTHLKFYNDTL